MEILSPVKNYESAIVAIQNGATAIYLSSPSFGARSKASLEIEEIENIVNYANNYDVKSFIAFNTVIFEEELKEFYLQIDKVYQIGASGIILQDVGLIKAIKDNYPDLEIHASTQMNIHNTSATKIVSNEGVNRIVVPREMNFERIKTIYDATKIDIEAFIHGALCVSYSGQCYDSTLLDQKSANRGRCSQYCRMPQKIINKRSNKVISKGRYPLNLKDLNNIDNVDLYEKAGVSSLKIEGRLKQLDYVGGVTRAYVNKYNKNEVKASDLENFYNRTFTTGRINSINGIDLVNLDKPNNSGYHIGSVVKIEKNYNPKLKYYKNIIEVKTNEELNLLDNIRYLDEENEDGEVVEQIEKIKNGYLIYSNCFVSANSKVYRTYNHKLYMEEVIKLNKFIKRNLIDIKIQVIEDEIFIEVLDNRILMNVKMQDSEKVITLKSTIVDKLLQTKNTYFDLNIVEFSYSENKFISFSDIKKLKREIILTIEKKKTIKRESKLIKYENNIVKVMNDDKVNYYVEVKNLEQYNKVKKYKNINVLIGNINILDKIEFDNGDFVVLPKIIYDDEYEEIKKKVKNYTNIIISEIGGLTNFQNKKIYTNFTLNTTNRISQEFLKNKGVEKSIISIELNKEKIENMANEKAIVNIYGRVPVMTMDYCPINLNKTNTCGECTRCHEGMYVLEDELNRSFPLLYEGNFRIGMYSNKPINLIHKRKEMIEKSIKNFHLSFSNESIQEIENILNAILFNKSISINSSSGSYYKEIL